MEVKVDFLNIMLTKRSGEIKEIHNESVSIGKKVIYVGNNSNWRLRWKDVQDLEVDDHDHCVRLKFSAGDVRALEYTQRIPRTWKEDCNFLDKCWRGKGKRDAVDRSLPKPAFKKATSFGRKRGTFGGPNGKATFKPLALRTTSKVNSIRLSREYSDYGSDNEEVITEHSSLSVGHRSEPKDVEDETKKQSYMLNTESDTEIAVMPPRLQKKQLKRRLNAKRTDTSSDTEEDSFGPAPLTTPAAQRVVSPTDALAEKIQKEQDDRMPAASSRGGKTIASFFAPRAKASYALESTADKVLDSRKHVPNNDHDLSFANNTSVAVVGMKSLSPLKKDSEWLSKTPSMSPSRDASVGDSQITPKPLSPTLSDKYASPHTKRSHVILEYDDNRHITPTIRKRLKIKSQRSLSRGTTNSLKLSDDFAFVADDDTLTPAPLSIETKENGRTSTDMILSTPRSSIPRSCWKGLRNMGNTCYLNASLQMLLSVKSFVSALEGWSGEITKSIVSVAKSLFESTSDSKCPNAKPVKTAIDKVTNKFAGFLQRDAHEFLSDLIDQVHNELEAERKRGVESSSDSKDGSNREQVKGYKTDNNIGEAVANEPSFEDGELQLTEVKEMKGEIQQGIKDTKALKMLPTDTFFRLNLKVRLHCTTCGYTRSKNELYRHLSLDVADDQARCDSDEGIAGSIQSSLERFFQPQEVEIKCEKCETGDRAVQTLSIVSQPKAVLLHLKRFLVVEERKPALKSDDEDNAENEAEGKPFTPFSISFIKNRSRVEIPECLALLPFQFEPNSGSDKLCYSLKSVVHHIGNTASSGHYTAHALRSRPTTDASESASTWVSFDDGVTRETTAAEVMSSIRSQRSAYMLLYACGD